MKIFRFVCIDGLIIGLIFSIYFCVKPKFDNIQRILTYPDSAPTVTHGNFDFALRYHVNGEEKRIADTVICNFDGFMYDEGRGRTRKWKGYYKNYKSIKLFANKMDIESGIYESEKYYREIILEDTGRYKIILALPPAAYFLGETSISGNYSTEEPSISIYDTLEEYYLDNEQLEQDIFSIIDFQVLDWYCDTPIKNTFK